MASLKQLLSSKTILFGLLLAIASAFQVMVPFLPAEYTGIAGCVAGVVVIALRFVTTLPLSDK